jgi:hypothetical protein
MTAEARLILKRTARIERWQHAEHGDYNLDRFDQEFRERLYSEEGRAILRLQSETVAVQTRKTEK